MPATRNHLHNVLRRCAPLLIFLSFTATVFAAGDAVVPRDAKCPVCGMFVAKYPDWSATLTYSDGTRRYFDGPKDLFVYYLNPRSYDPARKREVAVSITVKDYYSLAPIEAKKAFFVPGSDVLGPMGKELIPFARRSDAEGFREDHGGRRILRFDEVNAALLDSLK